METFDYYERLSKRKFLVVGNGVISSGVKELVTRSHSENWRNNVTNQPGTEARPRLLGVYGVTAFETICCERVASV